MYNDESIWFPNEQDNNVSPVSSPEPETSPVEEKLGVNPVIVAIRDQNGLMQMKIVGEDEAQASGYSPANEGLHTSEATQAQRRTDDSGGD